MWAVHAAAGDPSTSGRMLDALDLDVRGLLQTPDPDWPRRLSPITESSSALHGSCARPPDSEGSLIPILVGVERRQERQREFASRAATHGQTLSSSSTSSISTLSTTSHGGLGSIPSRSSLARDISSLVGPPSSSAIRGTLLPRPVLPRNSSPQPRPREEAGDKVVPSSTFASSPRLRSTSLHKAQSLLASQMVSAERVAHVRTSISISSNIMGEELVAEPSSLKTRPQARAQSAQSHHKETKNTSAVPKVAGTPRPRTALDTHAAASRQSSRPLSAQLTRANSLLGVTFRSSTPTHHRGHSSDAVNTTRPRPVSHIDRQPAHADSVSSGHTASHLGNSDHDAPRADTPIVRRPSVRISSFLHRIGQDAARRLSKSPAPSPLSVMTLLPDIEGDLVGKSPVRTAIRCSGTFGVADDGSDTNSVHHIPDSQYRRRTSTGSIEVEPIRRSLFLRNAHQADHDRMSESDENSSDLNRQYSTATTVNSSSQNSPPGLSRSASDSTVESTPPDSAQTPLSPCSTFPDRQSQSPEPLFLAASRLLSSHSALLFSNADALSAMSAAMRASASTTLALSEQLLHPNSDHELAPLSNSSLPSRESTETPKAARRTSAVGQVGAVAYDSSTKGTSSITVTAKTQPEVSAESSATPSHTDVFTDTERLFQAGRESLLAAEALWHQAIQGRASHIVAAVPLVPGSIPPAENLRVGSSPQKEATTKNTESSQHLSVDSLDSQQTPSPPSRSAQLSGSESPTKSSPECRNPSFEKMVEAGMKLMSAELDSKNDDWQFVKSPNSHSRTVSNDKTRGHRKPPPRVVGLEDELDLGDDSAPERLPLPRPVSPLTIVVPTTIHELQVDQEFTSPRAAPPIPSTPPASAKSPNPSTPPSAFASSTRLPYLKTSGHGRSVSVATTPTERVTGPVSCEPPKSSIIRRLSWRRVSQPEEPKRWFKRAT